jgi:DNA-binding transcriptional regulator YiaG
MIMSPPQSDIDLRLIRVLRRRWPSRDERAAALGLSTRQLQRWELDGDVPQIISRLIELGVIAIVDDPTIETPDILA